VKVSELRDLLNKFPQDAPVAFTYESVVSHLDEDEVYMSKDGVLMFGSEYREEFESGEWPARKNEN
jgi:hypothetical protein